MLYIITGLWQYVCMGSAFLNLRNMYGLYITLGEFLVQLGVFSNNLIYVYLRFLQKKWIHVQNEKNIKS